MSGALIRIIKEVVIQLIVNLILRMLQKYGALVEFGNKQNYKDVIQSLKQNVINKTCHLFFNGCSFENNLQLEIKPNIAVSNIVSILNVLNNKWYPAIASISLQGLLTVSWFIPDVQQADKLLQHTKFMAN